MAFSDFELQAAKEALELWRVNKYAQHVGRGETNSIQYNIANAKVKEGKLFFSKKELKFDSFYFIIQ